MSPAEFFFSGGWVLLAAIGLCLGAAINWAVYELAYYRRPISPWSPGRPGPVSWVDRLPVCGWISLRREEATWGKGFWIRPLLVELVTAVGVIGLYYWEVVERGIDFRNQPADVWTLHLRWIFHTILFALMAAGSLIDIDERTLPDALTLPGTFLGLAVAALYPWAMLPDVPPATAELPEVAFWESPLPRSTPQGAATGGYRFLHVGSPNPWPTIWDGAPRTNSLATALAIWWMWCFALMDRRWYSRLGFRRAWRYFWARLFRSRITHLALAMGVVGSGVITLVWIAGCFHWQGLFSALVGLGAGTVVVWLTRILGQWALQREAIGFGDVVLMGMLGTAVGWQGVIVIFFLAPLIALVFGIVQAIFRGETIIPYGPFLCLAAAIVILFWPGVWLELEVIFRLGSALVLVLAGCLLLLPPLLVVVRVVREVIESALERTTR